MAARPNEPKSIPQVATELWELTVAYAKQETIDPFKGLQRFLGFGVSGSLVFAFGSFLLLLSLLRVLQTETGTTFTGNLSWIPYLIVVLAAAALVGGVIFYIVKRKGPNL